MAQVRWSLTAGNDLQDIEDFIARDSVLHAITFVDRIVESTETLLKTPQIGRIVPEFTRPDLREVIFSWNHAQRRRRRSGDTDSQRQPRISDLMRGKIELFSVDTLITMLTHANLKVDVRVRRSAAA